MNIREANKFDLPYFINLIHTMNESNDLGSVIKYDLDDEYVNQIFATILAGGGIAYVAESDEVIGMIVGMIMPQLFAPNYYFMHQILYFVDPEYRFTKAGYLLFKEFDKKCEELIQNKRIHNITLSVPKTIIDMDFERFNYECVEKTWCKIGHRT